MQSKEVVPDVQIHNILADTAAEAHDVAKAQDGVRDESKRQVQSGKLT